MSHTNASGEGSSSTPHMGFAAIPNWLVRDPKINIHDKIVYAVLASHVTKSDEWYMSHAEIAEESGISVSSVQRALDRLRGMRLISWKGRIDPATGGRIGNSYRVYSAPFGQGDVPPQSEGPTPSVSVTEQEEEPKEEPIYKQTREEDQAFEAAWKAWPRKDGKKAAYTAWRRLTLAEKNRFVEPLIAHANAHRAHTPPRFIPMLATWLNGERWTDPLPTAQDTGTRKAEADPYAGSYVAPPGKRWTGQYDEVTGGPVWVDL